MDNIKGDSSLQEVSPDAYVKPSPEALAEMRSAYGLRVEFHSHNPAVETMLRESFAASADSDGGDKDGYDKDVHDRVYDRDRDPIVFDRTQ